jgi:hypothetical protein
MNKVDWLQTGGFPFELDDLDYMQNSFTMLQQLTLVLAGAVPAIVTGCVVSGGTVSDGYVIISGELLPFQGGSLGTKVAIVETDSSKNFEDGTSKTGYQTRTATFGAVGTDWSTFVRIPALVNFIKLIGGTTGQFLTKTTNTDYDFGWNSFSPMEYDGSTKLRTKVVPIGDWNMVSTSTVNVPHGISDFTKIRNVYAVIRDDSDTTLYKLDFLVGSAFPIFGGRIASINSTNVILSRMDNTAASTFIAGTQGQFTNAAFDSTGYNRGWIMITYEV